MVGAWVVSALLTAATATGAPLSVATRVECAAPEERCKAVEEVLGAVVKAEGMTTRGSDCGGEAWEAGCFELRTKVQSVTVFFELRDKKGVRLLSSTDVPEYRAKYGTQDALTLLAFATIALAPLAYDLHHPTSRADEERAWTIMARRVLRHGARGGSTHFGAQEVRGKRWAVAMGTPDVRRVRQVEQDMIIVESTYEPVAPDSDEAREGMYSAGLVLAGVAQALAETPNVSIGDGQARLIVIHDAHGRFGARFILRGNSALSGNPAFMSKLRGAIFMISAFPLSGFTRIELPLTVRPLGAAPAKRG